MATNFKAFVINLDSEVERRDFMTQQLEAAVIAFEIVSAVKGKTLDPAYVRTVYDESQTLSVQGKPLSLGEIGCALSHLGIYRHMVDRSLSVSLVLEDDALLHQDLAQVLQPLSEHIAAETNPTIYLLTHLIRYQGRQGVPVTPGYTLHPMVDACCAHGYLINKAAAQEMLALFEPITYPIDAWKRIAESGRIAIYGLNPYVVGHTQHAKDSNIEQARGAVSDDFEPKGWNRLSFYAHFYLYEKFLFQIYKLIAGLKKQKKLPWDLS
jgi:glycosyl transferase family 25